jgi:hypothetical protein
MFLKKIMGTNSKELKSFFTFKILIAIGNSIKNDMAKKDAVR